LRGFATALIDHDADGGRLVETQLRKSGECLFIRCDVTDDAAVRDAVARAIDAYGRLDAAFNAAGIDGEMGKATADCTMENWNRVIATDLTGLWSPRLSCGSATRVAASSPVRPSRWTAPGPLADTPF
jgi:NAD(P)-dependent dehydrogenase (short-subunit alcohol dehydrogenase family)